ncbi:MAG TPA: hypothetical protein VII06_43090 [Chloroflexota bacterium]
MAFIRSKRTSAGTVYQVVRSVRVGGVPRQAMLCSLGRFQTITGALRFERAGLAHIASLPGTSPWTESETARHQARIAVLERLQAETGLA